MVPFTSSLKIIKDGAFDIAKLIFQIHAQAKMDGGGDEKLQVQSEKKKSWPELFMPSFPCVSRTSGPQRTDTPFTFPVVSLVEGEKTVSTTLKTQQIISF